MDSFILKLQFLILFIICFFYGLTSHAAMIDLGEHSGFIRDSNGNYSQVSSNGTVRSLTGGTTLQVLEKPVNNTSKGNFQFDLTRTAAVDVARIGKTVRSIAVASGPVGIGLTAASLVCKLTNICNQAGEWLFGENVTVISTLNCSTVSGTSVYSYAFGGTYRNYKRQKNISCGGTTPSGWGITFNCGDGDSVFSCPWGDYVIQSAPTGSTPPEPLHTATDADWNSKESLLNDNRFIEPLVTGNHKVPVQNPSLSSPVTSQIAKETSTVKDGAGNTTGTQVTTTTAKIQNPGEGENPSNNPNIVNYSETTVINNYNINNELTGSTTTTTEGTQKPEPQSIKIEIDNMEDKQLDTYQVPVNFAYESWGSGSCPADRSVSYHYGTLNLTFQPACDFATGVQPVVLVISGIIAMTILSGVKLDA